MHLADLHLRNEAANLTRVYAQSATGLSPATGQSTGKQRPSGPYPYAESRFHRRAKPPQ
jgi:hypothetical protein